MPRVLARAGLSLIVAQLVAWASFALCLWIVALPLWIPSPVTMTVLTIFRR